MLTTDFYDILKQSPLRTHFSGVYPSDKVPSCLKVTHFIVCNIDDSSKPGSHWYIVYRPNVNTLECFDSLGFSEEKKQFLIESFNFSAIKKLKCNITNLQPSNSQSCGKYCLYFIYNRFYNQDLSFHDLMNEIFEIDTSVNETIVNNFYEDVIKT